MTDDAIYEEQRDDAWNHAVAGRLAALRNVPVDSSRLERAIAGQIRKPRFDRPAAWRRPVRVLAASVVLVSAILIALWLTASSGPATADAAEMVQVHDDMVAGRLPVVRVDSIRAANRMLNSESPGAPTLPGVPDAHVMACCMKSVQHKRMACVLLKDEGVPVTLSVASAADMKLTPAPTVRQNGTDYRVQHVGNLSMVMTERNGKWLCLIGQAPAEHLMDLSSQLTF